MPLTRMPSSAQASPSVRGQHVVEFHSTCHQAHQIDLHHLAKAVHQKFAAAIDHRTLRQHENVEPVESGFEFFDCRRITHIKL
jgi:hypothetical protein